MRVLPVGCALPGRFTPLAGQKSAPASQKSPAGV